MLIFFLIIAVSVIRKTYSNNVIMLRFTANMPNINSSGLIAALFDALGFVSLLPP